MCKVGQHDTVCACRWPPVWCNGSWRYGTVSLGDRSSGPAGPRITSLSSFSPPFLLLPLREFRARIDSARPNSTCVAINGRFSKPTPRQPPKGALGVGCPRIDSNAEPGSQQGTSGPWQRIYVALNSEKIRKNTKKYEKIQRNSMKQNEIQINCPRGRNPHAHQ